MIRQGFPTGTSLREKKNHAFFKKIQKEIPIIHSLNEKEPNILHLLFSLFGFFFLKY